MSERITLQQIIIPVWGNRIPEKALEAGRVLSKGFDKTLAVCAMTGQQLLYLPDDVVENRANSKGAYHTRLNTLVEQVDAVLVVLSDEEGIPLKRQLKMCRDLRIPYLFVKKDGSNLEAIKKIIVPVGFLVEEKEKGALANSFGRFFGSDIILLQPRDKGSKARQNLYFLKRLLTGYKQQFSIMQGQKSSFGIEKEAISLAQRENAELVFIMASREYGLDDLFFGSKEYHVLKKAALPVMVLNPRDDIYVLCGN